MTETVTLVFDSIDAVPDEDGGWHYNNIMPEVFRMAVPVRWTIRTVLWRLRKAGWHIPPGAITLDDTFSHDGTWELCCRNTGKPLWAIHEMR